MSEDVFVECCAPTLAGLKTGSMFSFPYPNRTEMTADLRRLNGVFAPRGLCVLPLRYRAGKALLYVFRPKELRQDLNRRAARELLTEAGYRDWSVACCLSRLRERLQSEEGFPHEIGLFLSYPPEDVKGFIADRDSYKAMCMWKIYGDEEKARSLCAKFEKCTACYCRQWQKGRRLEQLAVAG